MNINEINKSQKTMLSFEVFPPKKSYNIESLFDTIKSLKEANPAFISVTYGAGGSNKDMTVEISSRIKKEIDIEPLAHLTCVGADKMFVSDILDEMKANGIDNVLALRGDVPKSMDKQNAFTHFSYATDLLDLIREKGGFYASAAAYPEGHPQSKTKTEDMDYLKLKQDKGAVRFNTQLCFNTDTILRFLDDCERAKISVPISIGIMPILNPTQILRMVSLSGCSIPVSLAKLFALYGSDEEVFRKHGLEYAKNQVKKLLDHGIDGLHIYTMNRHTASLDILKDVGLI